jgi:hypothetical protein
MFQPGRGLPSAIFSTNSFRAGYLAASILADAPFCTLVQPTNAGLEVLGLREP